MQQLTPFIVNQQWITLEGFIFDKQNECIAVKIGQYNLVVSHEETLPWSAESKDSVRSTKGGIILQTGPDEFLVAAPVS